MLILSREHCVVPLPVRVSLRPNRLRRVRKTPLSHKEDNDDATSRLYNAPSGAPTRTTENPSITNTTGSSPSATPTPTVPVWAQHERSLKVRSQMEKARRSCWTASTLPQSEEKSFMKFVNWSAALCLRSFNLRLPYLKNGSLDFLFIIVFFMTTRCAFCLTFTKNVFAQNSNFFNHFPCNNGHFLTQKTFFFLVNSGR